jgi:PIN domain nuclease of toxin-antitoxin system
MRLLLDTHVLIWALLEPHKLSKEARATIQAPMNDVYFSAASIWEIAIKAQLGRVTFSTTPEDVVQIAKDSGFLELPVQAVEAVGVAKLPLHHRDPFDRLLIAQAIAMPATLVTHDSQLSKYPALLMMV